MTITLWSPAYPRTHAHTHSEGSSGQGLVAWHTARHGVALVA